MESMLYRGHRFLGDINHFWMAVRVWKTNLVVEDLARQKRTKIWPKWGLFWGLVDVWKSEWSVVSWIWITEPFTTFWPRKWAYRKFVQSWFQKNSPTNKRETQRICAWTSFSASKMTKIFFKHVITGDESWIFEYDPETKRQNSEWHRANHRAWRKQEWANRKSNPC